jgi:hypothetical protein
VSARTLIADRLAGRFEIDEWGADPALVDLIDPITALLLRIEVDGSELLPESGPALLIANRRVGAAEPFVVGRAVRKATGRRVRFLGVPDVPVAGPVLRRLGGGVDHPAELASLLRAGHLVALPLATTWRRPRRAGILTPESLVPALDQQVPVLPVSVVGGELTGRWRVTVGEPVELPAGRGPLALAELADAARAGVQRLLDEQSPPRWLLG